MATTPPPTLREVQQWMAALIVNPQRLDPLTPESDPLLGLVEIPPAGSITERLAVYTGGYPARLEEALGEAFPAVAHVVGAGAFHGMIRRYAAAVPLYSYNLSDAGARLPEFLVEDELTANLPFLPDLSRLEWHVTRAFHATHEPTFDPTPLTQWTMGDWEQAVLHFQPWAALVSSEWPIRQVWECRETPVDQIDVDLRDGADHVLVRRVGFTVLCESLEPAEADALAGLLEGQPLGHVAARLTNRGDDPASVSAWFARWVGLRMIVSCTC